MSSITIALITLAILFVSAMLGFVFRIKLPEQHLSEDSMRAVSLCTGLVATMAALVLSLMLSSAKTSFDATGNQVNQLAVKVVLLDHALANYGPETKVFRQALHQGAAAIVKEMTDGNGLSLEKISTPATQGGLEGLQHKLLELTPTTGLQRSTQARALQICNEMEAIKWEMITQGQASIPTPFLVILVLWLAAIFAGFGVMTANNWSVAATFFLGALSVSAALFLILEMTGSLSGLMRVSVDPMQQALAHIGK